MSKLQEKKFLLLPFLPEKSSSAGTFFKQINLEVNENVSAPFKTSLFVVKPDATSIIDKHQVKEIWIVLKGNGLLTCEDNICLLQEGNIIYFEPYASHQINNNGKENLEIISIWW